jgi:hypothetical protein
LGVEHTGRPSMKIPSSAPQENIKRNNTYCQALEY